MDEGLLDFIYEAAVLADRWPDVLDRVSASCGAKGGVLHVHVDTEHGGRWTASPGARAFFADYLSEGWHKQTDRVSRGLRLSRTGFLTDTDLLSEAELATQPVYRDFLIPRGLQATAATHVGCAPAGDLILSIWGFPSHALARASVPALDQLRPHLARASMLAARLQLERVRSAVEALALINVPSAILGQRRRVLASNSLFDKRLLTFGHDTPSGLQLSDDRANATFGDVLTQLEDARAGGASLPIRLRADRRAVLHVLPVRGAARDLMTGARALLVLTAPGRSHSPSLALIQGLFDLAPAEAKLAQALSETETVKSAARRLDITEGTARTQLKSIFSKTGVHSQSQLLVMLNQYNVSVELD
jgi:DNA-binding CsgD family transcriptional regulator